MYASLPMLILGITVALAGCQATPQEAAKPVRPVLVQSVAFTPQTPERTFVATIRPRVESDLGFRVPGKVARRLINVGDAVKVGQVLATLDATDLRLQREQAEAEVKAASAALKQAEAELQRILTLRGQGWSTTATFDRQQAVTEEARGRMARAERGLLLAANALSYAALTADIDGVVTATQIEPGHVVDTDKVAIRIARLSEKEAVIAVPEAQIAAVRTGVASLSLWSIPDKRYQATLRELSPSADPATRTYLARFSIPTADEPMQFGMTATVTIGETAAAEVVRLPLTSLHNQGDGPAVWVIGADGRPVLRPVMVAAYQSRDVLITQGVGDGERVVVLGAQKLDPGQRVRIVEALQF
ncbi:efflux RND transporter periplasmic adaptor subunit [Microvirga tunisiensis]|uniref:Efflux RND transporter periplasmic adaptor subunit n=1 Tax=Microvirga tunisiensis TaxID=2108360 RepID=A0A5N7MFW7_9HYPH|nr:efflux RND transporter periplasmic adaptor subunit [Microvirga tunisiensis]MPR07332.1 efflux RND transporter periplasmic adaptor subunit [Microvirga tunisiensis]MPR25693.1 efflux RND transporter periplasmic adaptor subunit [Microvirga tunisiensis]